MKKNIRLTRTYPYPVQKLWHALTDAEAMSQWLMPCDIKPEVGHRFKFKTKPQGKFDGIVHCEVLEVKEHELLSFSWSSGKLRTKVTFKLTPEGQRTQLDFEHDGFERLMDRLIVRNILASGWRSRILTVLLPKYLAENE